MMITEMRIDVDPWTNIVGGKLIKMLIFDKTNSKSVEKFCRIFSIVELSQ